MNQFNILNPPDDKIPTNNWILYFALSEKCILEAKNFKWNWKGKETFDQFETS